MNFLKNYSKDRLSNKSYLQLLSFDLPEKGMKDNDDVLITGPNGSPAGYSSWKNWQKEQSPGHSLLLTLKLKKTMMMMIKAHVGI